MIGAPEQRAINYATLTSNDAPVAVRLDFGKWIENILEVLPDTTHIAWVVGSSPLERFWTEEFRRASQPFAGKISFEWFNDLRFEEMLARLERDGFRFGHIRRWRSNWRIRPVRRCRGSGR